jgi:hypothetical protein
MGYTPPSGWVEPLGDGEPASAAQRFHSRPDCPRIRHPEQLREVDRPYSAARCPGCADPHGNNLEDVTRA